MSIQALIEKNIVGQIAISRVRNEITGLACMLAHHQILRSPTLLFRPPLFLIYYFLYTLHKEEYTLYSTKVTPTTLYAFWQTAAPKQQLDRLAFYRERRDASDQVLFIAAAGPWVTLGVTHGVEALVGVASRYCPYEVEPPIVITDPFPRECRDQLQVLFASAHARGSWYRREPLEPLLRCIASHPAPARAPGVPDLPKRLTDEPPRNKYQEKLHRAEAIAYLRGIV